MVPLIPRCWISEMWVLNSKSTNHNILMLYQEPIMLFYIEFTCIIFQHDMWCTPTLNTSWIIPHKWSIWDSALRYPL